MFQSAPHDVDSVPFTLQTRHVRPATAKARRRTGLDIGQATAHGRGTAHPPSAYLIFSAEHMIPRDAHSRRGEPHKQFASAPVVIMAHPAADSSPDSSDNLLLLESIYRHIIKHKIVPLPLRLRNAIEVMTVPTAERHTIERHTSERHTSDRYRQLDPEEAEQTPHAPVEPMLAEPVLAKPSAMVAAAVIDHHLYLVNDSHCGAYLLRQGQLRPLWPQQAGTVIQEFALEQEETVLICSGTLPEALGAERIQAWVDRCPLDEAAQHLVAHAHQQNQWQDFTAVLMRHPINSPRTGTEVPPRLPARLFSAAGLSLLVVLLALVIALAVPGQALVQERPPELPVPEGYILTSAHEAANRPVPEDARLLARLVNGIEPTEPAPVLVSSASKTVNETVNETVNDTVNVTAPSTPFPTFIPTLSPIYLLFYSEQPLSIASPTSSSYRAPSRTPSPTPSSTPPPMATPNQTATHVAATVYARTQVRDTPTATATGTPGQ